ncbi:MAG: glutathione synthase, partial [Pseudomonadota bacterium]
MKIAFIVDPLAGLKAYKDSSIMMMREAAKRGHAVYAFEANGIVSAGNVICARASKLTISNDNNAWHYVDDKAMMALTDFDVVLMRKDPPFDQEYLYATLLLSMAESQGARVVNRPASLRDYNEKLAILKFSEFISPTLVSSEMA